MNDRPIVARQPIALETFIKRATTPATAKIINMLISNGRKSIIFYFMVFDKPR